MVVAGAVIGSPDNSTTSTGVLCLTPPKDSFILYRIIQDTSSPDNANLRDWLPVVLVYLFWLALMVGFVAVGLGWRGFRFLANPRGRKENL